MIETPDIESSSPAYASRFAGQVGGYFLDVQQQALAELIGDARGLQVLDVGGGHAQLTPYLVERDFEVTVLGSTDDGRMQLDERIGADAYHYDTGNLLSLPYPDQSFDVVIAIRLLPHLVQWEAFITELCRVSRRGVIVDYPDKRSVNFFADALFTAKKAIEKDTRTYHCFHGKEIQKAFAESHFNSVKTIRQFAAPMALHRAMGRRSISEAIEKLSALVGLQRLIGSPVLRRFDRTSAHEEQAQPHSQPPGAHP